MEVIDNEYKEQMRKMTNIMKTVGNSISQSLTPVKAIIDLGQLSFVINQHQNVGNNDVTGQENIDGFLERTFSIQN